MMKCAQCNNEQAIGKFCAKCGTPLLSKAQQQQVDDSVAQNVEQAFSQPSQQMKVPSEQNEAAHQQQQIAGSNEKIEKGKEVAQAYGTLFVSMLKKPTSGSNAESNFIYAIISIVLLSFVNGLVLYEFANRFFGMFLSLFLDGFNYFFNGFFGGAEDQRIFSIKYIIIFAVLCAISSFISFLVLYLINKFILKAKSFKTVMIEVTNYYPILIVVLAVSYIVLLIGLLKVGAVLFILASLIIYTLLPLFIVATNVEVSEPKVDKFFIYILTLVAILLLTYVVNEIVGSILGDLVTKDLIDLENRMDSLWD